MQGWGIISNSNDCGWGYIRLPEDIKDGLVDVGCFHPDNASENCREGGCPKRLDVCLKDGLRVVK